MPVQLSEKQKLRILFHPKDHPWRTDSGYSIAARYLVQGLYDDFDLGVFAPVGQKYKTEYYFPDLGFFCFEPEYSIVLPDKTEISAGPSVPIFPGVSEDYGEQILEEHFQKFQAELLWMIADGWALGRTFDLASQDRIRLILQIPVDFTDPVPQYYVDRLSKAMRVVPWVKDGYDRLVKAGLKNVAEPIPLGINTDLWKPQDRSSHRERMSELGFRYDTFNISMVNANQYGRKAWDAAIKGIKLFRDKRPEVPLRVYMHTNFSVSDGWDMNALLTHFGLTDIVTQPHPYYMMTGQYTEYQTMLMHALADVVVNVGLEGFGYATIQAQACGTPVIGLNAGATPELTKSGVLVPPYAESLTGNLLGKVDPHPVHVAAALEQVYETPRSDYQKGVQFVKDNFSWPLVISKWKKLFEDVDAELERKCIKSRRYPPAPSARALEMSKVAVDVP